MKTRAYISAISHWVPEKILSNKDLEKMVDTTDEWIRTRTGIKERRILDEGKAPSDMGAEAVKILLKNRGISADDIDVIVVATVTPDMFFPSTANLIQEKIGAKNAFGFDISAACSGFVYALQVGAQFIETGRHKKVVVVGTDKMSAITNYTDRNTCVLFGDAAGVVLLEPTQEEDIGIIDFLLHSDGAGADYLHMKAGGSKFPATVETVANDWHYIYQDGKAVFKLAVQKMADVSEQVLVRNSYSGKDLKLLVPHQANLRIIDAAVKRLGIDYSKVAINIEKYGNTTAATIPLALSEAYQEGKLEKGDLVVLATFGAGFTWGSALLKWGLDNPTGK
ncbi:beta-ketoacyl-ACP synthase III [Calditrichota bacterium]